MSWIGGSIILKDDSKKSLQEAYTTINSNVRHEADLEEFPNMGGRLRIVKESNKIFESYEDAERYSMDISLNWERKRNIMLAFKDHGKESKKIKELKTRMENECKKKNQYFSDHLPYNSKSAYVSCQHCGSKLNKKYIQNYRCPVCHGDIKSETVKNNLAKYDEKIKKIKSQISAEERKQVRGIKYAVFYCEYVG